VLQNSQSLLSYVTTSLLSYVTNSLLSYASLILHTLCSMLYHLKRPLRHAAKAAQATHTIHTVSRSIGAHPFMRDSLRQARSCPTTEPRLLLMHASSRQVDNTQGVAKHALRPCC